MREFSGDEGGVDVGRGGREDGGFFQSGEDAGRERGGVWYT